MTQTDTSTTLPTGAIPVLDKGYVMLVGLTCSASMDAEGNVTLTPTDDLRAVADARTSTGKPAVTMGKGELRTLAYLITHGHTSPFRGQVMTVEVRAPLMVARQMWKYCVGHEHTEGARDCFLQWNEECVPAHQPVAKYFNGSITVGTLYQTFKNNPSKLPLLRSVDDRGIITKGKIKRIWEAGTQRVYKVTSILGNTIESTATHRYAVPTDEGFKYVPLSEIKAGDKVMMNGIPAYRNEHWLRTEYVEKSRYQSDIAKELGCSEHVIRKWVRVFNLQQDQIARMQRKNTEQGVYGKGMAGAPEMLERGRKTGDAMRGRSLDKRGEAHHCWKGNQATINAGHHRARDVSRELEQLREGCCVCRAPNAQIHHIDRNPLNNDPSNLQSLCSAHHTMAHHKNMKLAAHPVEVASIEYVGEMPVYDIEMEGFPNFVAANFVVHNSRRYVDQEPQFHAPAYWRKAPERRSQGSIDEPHESSDFLTCALEESIDRGQRLYQEALARGVCAEQARLFLPAYGLYVTWRWTMSLQGWLHMEAQRLPHDAQWETREYAHAIFKIGLPLWPIATRGFLGEIAPSKEGAS